MELRTLRYFEKLAELGHVTEAASRLGIAQPALTAQLRRLEAELGLQLVQKAGRGIELTEAGRRFYFDLQEVLGGLSSAVAAAQATAKGQVGRLVLGFTESISFTGTFLAAVRDFRARFPGIELVLQEARSFELRRAIERAEMHCAFLRPPVTSGRLRTITVAHEPLVLAMPLDHPLAGRDAVGVQDFAGEPFIGLTPRPEAEGLSVLIDQAFARHGLRRRVVHLSPGFATALNMVLAGMGVAIVPQSMSAVRQGEIGFVPISGADLRRSDIALAYDSRRVGPATRSFLGMMNVPG